MAEFKDLPVEIRSAIWAEALSDADGVVYHFKPEDFGLTPASGGDFVQADGYEPRPEVIVAFPTIMHLCRESREYVKSQLSFMEDAVLGVHIPCRRYRPETDVFFVNHHHYDSFRWAFDKAQVDEDEGKLKQGDKAFYREISRFGLDSTMLMMGGTPEAVLSRFAVFMTALRHVCLVCGNTDDLDLTRPLRMYEGWAAEETEAPRELPGTEIHVQETLDYIGEVMGTWETVDTSPWDEETGEWLFEVEAGRIAKVSGLV